MAWHEEKDEERIKAYEANKASFEQHNVDVDIITVKNPFKNSPTAWLNTDISVFKWFIENKDIINYERFIIVEWDCWCDCSIQQYFSRVWDCEVVVPNIKFPERDDWYWFSTIGLLPLNAQPFAAGITPMTGVLISNNAMTQISKEILKPQYASLNSELRLGTIATMLNLDPVVNPSYTRALGWKGICPFDLKYKGLHHPRKTLIAHK